MTVQDQVTETVAILPPMHEKKASFWKRHRKLLMGGSAGLVVVVVLFTLFFGGSSKVQYQTARVDRGDIEAAITATGSTNAVVSVQVGSQVSGNIIALNADFNTKVKKGQLVARIDPAPFQARVDQAKANLDSAQASVVSARAGVKKAEADTNNAIANVATQKANLVHAQSAVTDAKVKNDRRVQLLKDGIVSQEDANTTQATYDQAVATVDATQAQLNAAQSMVDSAKAEQEVAQTQLSSAQASVMQNNAALKQAQLDLDHTQIIAPVDGTVVSRNMDVGQTVAASFQAPTIFLIAQDLTKMQVDTNVDESDIGGVRVGQAANFTVDAYPGVVFPGTVSQIRQAPLNVQNVVTYDVVVQVANPDLKLFPGMTANVKIVTNNVSDTLRIPSAALRFRPATAVNAAPAAGQRQGKGKGSGQGTRIYVLDEKGQPKAVPVKLGITDGNFIQVSGGLLTEGQQVITGTVGTAAKPAPAAQQNSKGGGTRRLGF